MEIIWLVCHPIKLKDVSLCFDTKRVGVPQRTVLGSSTSFMKCDILLFTNDTFLYFMVVKWGEVMQVLNEEMRNAYKGLSSNNKTKFIIIKCIYYTIDVYFNSADTKKKTDSYTSIKTTVFVAFLLSKNQNLLIVRICNFFVTSTLQTRIQK